MTLPIHFSLVTSVIAALAAVPTTQATEDTTNGLFQQMHPARRTVGTLSGGLPRDILTEPEGGDSGRPSNGSCFLIDHGYCLDASGQRYNNCSQFNNPNIQTITACQAYAEASGARGFSFLQDDDQVENDCILHLDVDVDVLESCPFEDRDDGHFGYNDRRTGMGPVDGVARNPFVSCYQCQHTA